MKPTLLILAAGMASRYGSMKQTEGFGPNGETIMEYSIYDAIRAGFGKVVFIIRADFADKFKEVFEPKLKGKIQTEYVFQDRNAYVPNEVTIPEERSKPWGTAHAVLCAKEIVHEPFAVINADDFYGADGFVKAAGFLTGDCSEKQYAIIGYELAKTLSEHGSVSRGVCEVDAQHNLISVKERTKIYREEGEIVYEEGTEKIAVPNDSSVSMNFWCFHPSMFVSAENQFHQFLSENSSQLKAEFFITMLGDEFVQHQGGNIKVIQTGAQWFGVTYKEDAPAVKASVDALIASGAYPSNLWL